MCPETGESEEVAVSSLLEPVSGKSGTDGNQPQIQRRRIDIRWFVLGRHIRETD